MQRGAGIIVRAALRADAVSCRTPKDKGRPFVGQKTDPGQARLAHAGRKTRLAHADFGTEREVSA